MGYLDGVTIFPLFAVGLGEMGGHPAKNAGFFPPQRASSPGTRSSTPLTGDEEALLFELERSGVDVLVVADVGVRGGAVVTGWGEELLLERDGAV